VAEPFQQFERGDSHLWNEGIDVAGMNNPMRMTAPLDDACDLR
jgi:hypothetical protein